ncbi:hypothetical protein HDU97_006038 [Phlyctochytrium planicorne]|nr:hypothetical protein HDU97_006038 [Phlyctochytrium planicorne]
MSDQDVENNVKEAKLASVISRILTTEVKQSASRPILSRQKGIERKIDNEKLEARAKRLVSAEKKQKKDSQRLKPTSLSNELEKKLRKIATRGGSPILTGFLQTVVKLFNAIAAEQKVLTAEAGPTKKAKTAKTSFLQMVEGKPSTSPNSTNKGGTGSGSSKSGGGNAVKWLDDNFLTA